MDYKDYYRTLGVSKDASQDEIRRAFRQLAREHHPDVNPDDSASEERFKEINEAYEVLSDPEKRKKYDRFGTQWRQYERGGGRPEDFDWSQWQAQPGGGTSYRTVSPEEFEQIFGGAGGFSDFFETLFGGRSPGGGGFRTDFGGGRFTQQQRVRPRSGRDVEQKVEITLEEAFQGTTRTLQYEQGRTIQAKIPPGVKTGSRVRLSGQGQPGAAGGDPGNLYLVVTVLPDERFERKGDDLYVDVPVELYTALLGGTVVVPSIDRQVRLSIPPQTENGKTFRLDGLGMPRLRNPEKRGNLYATVDVQLPQSLSEEEEELFKKLRELRENSD